MPRCAWAGTDPLYVKYHDEEWGVPLHDDRRLFEMLILEGAQAGLSWITILRKREAYRKAFAGFDPEKVARFDAKKVAALLQNERVLKAATIATDRVVAAIADAVREQRSCGVGYGMRRQAPRTRAPASGIAVDRKL